jgi:hypothetical protein
MAGIGDDGKPILLSEAETPQCVTTMTPEVYAMLDACGEFAKYGVEPQPKKVFIKNDTNPRTVHYFVHVNACK